MLAGECRHDVRYPVLVLLCKTPLRLSDARIIGIMRALKKNADAGLQIRLLLMIVDDYKRANFDGLRRI